MKLRRIMIAAPKSGSGKTTVTCALLRALTDMGQQVCAYKCGPDYIDPMFHRAVLGVPSKNLDTFFTGEETTRRLFLKDRTENETAVLEGVMGLFDGLGGIREEGSAYHLAKVTKTPILLVVDAKGMGRSVLPLIAGFLAYDTEHLIQGVILNRMSKPYFTLLKPLIETELKIKAVGYLPNEKAFQIESRHLGLQLPEEITDLRERIGKAAEAFAASVSVEEILKIAESAEELESAKEPETVKKSGIVEENKNAPILAVAKDEAFCFYYEDNLRLLEEYGARLRYFSPLHDTALPEGTSGILIGGGYPELYGKELSANEQMRAAIRKAFSEGMPLVAECGGFMYLHSFLTVDGIRYPMAGVVPEECRNTGKLVRFGYIELRERKNCFLPDEETIRGHEFHYFDSTENGDGFLARKPVTGREYSCMITGETYCIGFPHLYYPSNPEFVKSFVEKMKERYSDKK